jgi:hypothetical protein
LSIGSIPFNADNLTRIIHPLHPLESYYTNIHQKVKCICGADHGLGGARSIEKARLNLSLEPGKCIIRKAKIFKQKDRNPNGLSLEFKIAGGARFIPDAAGWRREG